ncbi:epidermal retinol dehydrogenase 2-like [Schistocerca gregaria]|uniref:epidermal retinol dehydrogenase 2-like n=1 Tax=Schistocerca gregaria TaxID=7010 RepID=UPI00211E6013|nr:epidermal retinol dehydrogenase 2-like [Schistocerca gregaria]
MTSTLYYLMCVTLILWVTFRLKRWATQKNLKGEYALITGGASGIGKWIAIKLAQEGAHIILWDIDKENLERAKAELEARGVRVYIYQLDLSVHEEVKRIGQRTLEEVGRVDVLVNNVGIVSGRLLDEIPDQMIDKILSVNIGSHIWTVKTFLPGMKRRNRGHIVTISSMAGYVSVPKMTVYSASKFAAVGFSECLRVELKKLHYDGVHTTCVCPFYVNTGMFEGAKLNTLFSFLLPVLEPEHVASKTISAIKKKDEVVILPTAAKLVFLIRFFPVPVQDWILSFVGIYDTMDAFNGSRPIHKDEKTLN